MTPGVSFQIGLVVGGWAVAAYANFVVWCVRKVEERRMLLEDIRRILKEEGWGDGQG